MKNAIVLGVVAIASFVVVPAVRAEGPPSWVADVVKQVRAEYKLEKRQHAQILAAIQKDARGKELVASGKLDKAITAGLKKATERQKEIDDNPGQKTASPAVAAAMVIFDECGVKYPE